MTGEVTLNLPEQLIQEARELGLLSDDVIAEMLQAEIDRRKHSAELEAEWEAEVLAAVMGDTVDAEGNIDFDRLSSLGRSIALNELYNEDDFDNDPESAT
jgi:hypothetical protein